MEKKGLSITRPDRAAFAARLQAIREFFAPKIGANLISAVAAAQLDRFGLRGDGTSRRALKCR